ncbi:ribonuclease J [Patescibacteria group bacterium]|nr:ribonuclease J [Patescibacteria group bacterium]MBU1890477.1 ribonuclease J [Patescibacteria group bacterium]
MVPKKTKRIPRRVTPQPKLNKNDKLRIIPLGGLEEVGRNMIIFEYKQDIIIVDMGLQFPEEDMPGIDYIIPNISYLKGKEKLIKGVIITHGHYDHIGAIPHLIPRLGRPPVFGTPLTLGIIAKRQEDYKNGGKLDLQSVDSESKLRLGVFELEFFGVSHNIPGSLGVIINTPVGKIVHTGDFKLDLHPSGDTPTDLAKIAKLSDQNVLAMLSDSTNAPQPGHQFSEQEIMGNLEDIFRVTEGRLIIGTFASLLGRIQQIVELAEKYGRHIILDGYSMKTNVEIAQQLGYMKIKSNTLISYESMKKLPSNKLVILCTGAQGEGRAVLMRLANREHKKTRITKGDTVVFSSSVVPGNERSVQRLIDTLYREGAEVINYKMMDIHSGGHARQEDLKLMLKLINPQYLIPIEGNHSFLKIHAKIAIEIGFDPKNIFIADNGQIIEFSKQGGRLTSKKVPSEYVMVDGLGVGDVSSVVLRDRKQLAEDGMVVVIATIEGKTGRLIGRPDIISRGFVYMKSSQQLIDQTRNKVKDILKDREPKSSLNETYIKNKLRDDLGKFLFQKTERRPMIMPVIIEV